MNHRNPHRSASRGGGSRDDAAKRRHKTLQLCRQVHQTLDQCIASLGDVMLDVSVESVTPAPDASRLLVRLTLLAHASTRPTDVHARLDRGGVAQLRAKVAAAITRKRAPELGFIVVAPTGPADNDEGRHDHDGR